MDQHSGFYAHKILAVAPLSSAPLRAEFVAVIAGHSKWKVSSLAEERVNLAFRLLKVASHGLL